MAKPALGRGLGALLGDSPIAKPPGSGASHQHSPGCRLGDRSARARAARRARSHSPLSLAAPQGFLPRGAARTGRLDQGTRHRAAADRAGAGRPPGTHRRRTPLARRPTARPDGSPRHPAAGRRPRRPRTGPDREPAAREPQPDSKRPTAMRSSSSSSSSSRRKWRPRSARAAPWWPMPCACSSCRPRSRPASAKAVFPSATPRSFLAWPARTTSEPPPSGSSRKASTCDRPRRWSRVCRPAKPAAATKPGQISPLTRDAHVASLENQLRERLGTKVHLRYTHGKGALEVAFFSDAELERILQVLGISPD